MKIGLTAPKGALLGLALLAACTSEAPRRGAPSAAFEGCAPPFLGLSKPMFHGDRARTGWNDEEASLAPSAVAARFGPAWSSAPFDGAVVEGAEYVGRAYASLLYQDGVTIEGGVYDGVTTSVLYAATSNGFVYAVSAFDTPCGDRTVARGTILWRSRLVSPGVPPRLDGRFDASPRVPGIAVGVLSTPVLDGAGRLYVVAMDAAGGGLPTWKAFAIDARSGQVLPGWPLALSRAAVEAENKNGPAYFDDDARVSSQRSALALSPAGDRLYVAFGGYWDEAVGWLVAIDTRKVAVAASFSGAPDELLGPGGTRARRANAGMWAPSGPAIDVEGRVYMNTGNSPEESGPAGVARTWGNSMLRWSPDLELTATYTPFNHCALDDRDIDLGGSSPLLLPSLAATKTTTPQLIAFGGKEGAIYLLDAARLPGGTERRPACSARWDDAARDPSLLPPEPAPPYCDNTPADPCQAPPAPGRCVPGPVVAFGPPGDDAAVDFAKMRSTPAYFRDASGRSFLYVSGSTKAGHCNPANVPPSLVRLRVVAEQGAPAYLKKDGADTEIAWVNPGAPVVSSDHGRDPVVWVVDRNAKRTQPLLDPATPQPILYAVDGVTLKVLFKSEGALFQSGKYVTPVVAHGAVFVATDRVQAFALRD